MSNTLFYLAVVVMLAVAAVLFAGIRNFFKGGSGNFSNSMMRLRILLQLVAVVVLIAALWFSGR